MSIRILPTFTASDKTRICFPLHDAARRGHIPTLQVQIKSFDIDSKDIFGWSAVYYAVLKGHVDAADFLLRCGAKKEAKVLVKNNYFSLEELSIMSENINMVKYFLRKSDDKKVLASQLLTMLQKYERPQSLETILENTVLNKSLQMYLLFIVKS